MAKIKNKFAFSENTGGKKVTVGNNRQVETSEKETRCYLHGHNIVTLDRGTSKLVLDHCGYMTTTTRSAMIDFINSLCVAGNVSFAKGEFWAIINGTEHTTNERRMEIDLA